MAGSVPPPEEWILPAYRVALSADEAFMLGTFTAIWGQIDFFIGLCTAALLKTEFYAAEVLMQNMTTGPRLNLFMSLIRERVSDKAVSALAKEFNSGLSALIEKRNQLMHGMWGIVSDAGKITSAGSYHAKHKTNYLMADELPKLINDASRQTHHIVRPSRSRGHEDRR